jgi:hypothetical protein
MARNCRNVEILLTLNFGHLTLNCPRPATGFEVEGAAAEDVAAGEGRSAVNEGGSGENEPSNRAMGPWLPGGRRPNSAIYGRSIELSDGHSSVGSAQTTDLPPTVILVK